MRRLVSLHLRCRAVCVVSASGAQNAVVVWAAKLAVITDAVFV